MKTIKNSLRRAFTIVELVIVIAVIAILAGVLIPTFSSVVRKSQISADVQLCRNLNTVLSYASAEGRIPQSVYDVLYLENEAGYIIENLNPTADEMYFAWDQENNQMIYLNSDLTSVYYPTDYTLKPGQCWVTVGSKAEAEKVGSFGYNLALEKDFDEIIELSNVVSIDTLGFKCAGVTMQGGSASVENAKLIGEFGSATISNSVSNITTSGAINTLNVQGANSITVSGSVSNFSAASSVTSTVSSTGTIKTVIESSAASITNNGVVATNNSSATVVGENTHVRSISTKEAIESIRTQISSGANNFKGETIQLAANINLNGIAFSPMSNHNRDDRDNKEVTDTWFQGTFDGQGNTLKGFSNNGFTINGLNSGTNESSVKFGDSQIIYNEAVYGLFGTVYNATIKNLNIEAYVDMKIDHSNKYVGDSVGAIIGFAYGDAITGVTIENCTVSGSIVGYDGVAAFIGRSYAKKTTFKNCVNNANVTGVRKTAAFVGSLTSNCTVILENCVNNGNIQCLGLDYDKALDASIDKGAANGSGYYVARVVACNGPEDSTYTGYVNNGTVKVGE